MGDKFRKLSGGQLVGQAQDIWQQQGDLIPQQHKRELGQVLTELSSRITYVCQGEQPVAYTKYSALGGSELAQHATRTFGRVSSDLPVESRGSIQEVITEMASRVEHAAIGSPTPTAQEHRQIESEWEHSAQRQSKQNEAAVFA